MKSVIPAFAASILWAALPVHAHQGHTGGIHSAPAKAVNAPFDIIHTKIAREGNTAVFHIAVSGEAGRARPSATGKLAGSSVFSYVWPTTLDPSAVGFDKGAGILAFAVTSHPDFVFKVASGTLSLPGKVGK
ncbi:hypothetical protein [Massilia mucilaginosa]|uniref:hypothetical protein n=1 Tax=Massilia mucilaginosa TaxID=2609282 RepID=UPI001CB70571|nr:hypothetical protein [Massilia mucilaginosa]